MYSKLSLLALIIFGVFYRPIASEHSIAKRSTSTEIDVEDCGTLKSCFISSEDCDRNPNHCNYVLKWRSDGKQISFDLKGKTDSWITVQFSNDKNVGDDNVISCWRDLSSNKVVINHYYYEGPGKNLVKLDNSNNGVTDNFGIYDKDTGVIHCNFTRLIKTNNEFVKSLDRGFFVSVGNGKAGDQIETKLQNLNPSDRVVEFHTVPRVYKPTNWLVKIHAIIMIIAWILLASIGIIMARYYKPLWPNHIMFKVKIWFSFHWPLMLTVLVLSLLAFLAILLEMGFTWSVDKYEFIHSILGIIVICLTIINPILGVCRPKPDSRWRCLFFWFHWLIGSVAYCLSVPAIFIGMDLAKIDLPNWCSWLLFAWVIFHIIIELILEIHYCCTFQRHEERYSEYTIVDKDTIVMKRKNPPGYRWKPTLLFIYIAVTAIVVCALVIAVILHHIF